MISVRAVRPDEWAKFRDVRVRSLREDPAAFGARWEDEVDRDEAFWQERLRRPGTVRFIAEDGDGGAWLGLAGGGLHEDGPPEVFGMWVAPEARGRGVGLLLLDAVAAWAREQGASRLALWVNVKQEPALRLYQRAGFAPEAPPQPGTRDPTRSFQRWSKQLDVDNA